MKPTTSVAPEHALEFEPCGVSPAMAGWTLGPQPTPVLVVFVLPPLM